MSQGSPGVSIKERDFSDYVESAGSLSVGILGVARRGSIYPKLITSQNQLIAEYGEPRPDDYGLQAAYAILAQSNIVYFGRVTPKGVKAVAGEVGVDKFLFTAKSAGADMNTYKIDISEETQVNLDPDQPSVTVPRHTVKLLNSSGGEVESYVVSVTPEDTDYAIKVINDQSLYFKAVAQNSGSIDKKTLKFSKGEDGATYAYAGTDDTEFKFRSRTYDSTINNAKVIVGEEDKFGYFDITIIDNDDRVIDMFKSVTRDPKDDNYVDRYINKYSNRVIVTYNKESESKEKTYVFSGGTDKSDLVNYSDYLGNRIDSTGIQMFYNPETVDINILAIPGMTNKTVLKQAMQMCENRGECILVMDTPFGLNPQGANDYANATGPFTGSIGHDDSMAFNSSYAAVYWPWVKVPDVFSKQDIWLPPTGDVIAQMAYSDVVGKPWFAPAGLNRGILNRVIDIEYYADKPERDIIYGNRNVINPLVRFTGDGIIIWGQKTTQRKASSLDRINVRRLMNYLKKIVQRSTLYFVFEDNTEYTWDKWVDMVEPRLSAIKSERGIYDMKIKMRPTEDDIRNNIMPGIIWVKPTRTGEEIPLEFRIMPDSVSFEEDSVIRTGSKSAKYE